MEKNMETTVILGDILWVYRGYIGTIGYTVVERQTVRQSNAKGRSLTV